MVNIPDWYVKDDWYAKQRHNELLQEARNERALRKLVRRLNPSSDKKS